MIQNRRRTHVWGYVIIRYVMMLGHIVRSWSCWRFEISTWHLGRSESKPRCFSGTVSCVQLCICSHDRVRGSGGLGFGPIHEGFDPAGAVDELGGCYDILCAAVLHLGQEAQGCDLSVGHPSEEEHQGGPVLSLLAWGTVHGCCVVHYHLPRAPTSTTKPAHSCN